jgi:hypothetical protein
MITAPLAQRDEYLSYNSLFISASGGAGSPRRGNRPDEQQGRGADWFWILCHQHNLKKPIHEVLVGLIDNR